MALELVRETTAGCVWQCNGCPFKTGDMTRAAGHAVDSGHAVYEIVEGTPVGRWDGWASAAARFIHARDGRALVSHRPATRGRAA